MHSNALTCIGESNKKKERVPDGPTIKYSQGIQNSCIISSLASELYYMGDELALEYIIRRKQQSLYFIHIKGRMQFFRDTLMGQIPMPTSMHLWSGDMKILKRRMMFCLKIGIYFLTLY